MRSNKIKYYLIECTKCGKGGRGSTDSELSVADLNKNETCPNCNGRVTAHWVSEEAFDEAKK